MLFASHNGSLNAMRGVGQQHVPEHTVEYAVLPNVVATRFASFSTRRN
jgi:hypothetical protein